MHRATMMPSRRSEQNLVLQLQLTRFRLKLLNPLPIVGRPGTLSRVYLSLLEPTRNVSGLTPTRCPTRITAWFPDNSGSSFHASCTSLAARSRNSGGYSLKAGTVSHDRATIVNPRCGHVDVLRRDLWEMRHMHAQISTRSTRTPLRSEPATGEATPTSVGTVP